MNFLKYFYIIFSLIHKNMNKKNLLDISYNIYLINFENLF
jgi:hypothetical protein